MLFIYCQWALTLLGFIAKKRGRQLMELVYNLLWIGKRQSCFSFACIRISKVANARLLAHPEVSDEPDEDTAPQALGSGSTSNSNPSKPASEAPKESEEGILLYISNTRIHS